MTLAQWLEDHPYRTENHGNGTYSIADIGPKGGVSRTKRAEAWHLEDYYVVGIAGGSIWLCLKPNHGGKTLDHPENEF